MAGGTDPFFICEESTPNDDSTSLSFLEDSLSTVVNSTRACVSSNEDSLSTSHWRSPRYTRGQVWNMRVEGKDFKLL